MNKLWEEFKKEAEIDLQSLVPKESLNENFWNRKMILRKSIRQKLLQIAQDFFESLNLSEEVELKDITITGSIASYNWSKYSDVDLHLILNFSQVDENQDLVKEYFGGKIFVWNNKHNIRMNDHEVEIYVQNESEPHMAAGVYSVLNNNWIEEPTKAEFEVDLQTTKKKADQLIDQIERIYDIFEFREYQKSMEAGKRLKEKIKEMRRAGLADEGVYSPENMAFKLLRRSKHIELLHKIISRSYDKIMSLHKDVRGSLKIMISNLEDEISENYDPVVLETSFQRRMKQKHYLKKKWLVGQGSQKNSTPYKIKPNYKRSKSAPAGFGGS
jgi:predicted nucleotidyltransferase